jgi:hypothetical protein
MLQAPKKMLSSDIMTRRNTQLEYVMEWIAYIDAIEKRRGRRRRLFSRWRQEYIDGIPLWEVFFGPYNGRVKLPAIEAQYHRTKAEWTNKKIEEDIPGKQYREMLGTLHDAFRSAILDPRLTILAPKTRPILVQKLRKAFASATSKITKIALVTAPAATLGPIIMEITAEYFPEFTAFTKYIPYGVLARSTTLGAMVSIIAYVWKYWRDNVSRSVKLELIRIRYSIEELESTRNARSIMSNSKAARILDKQIMLKEREIKKRLDPIFDYAIAQIILPAGIATAI